MLQRSDYVSVLLKEKLVVVEFTAADCWYGTLNFVISYAFNRCTFFWELLFYLRVQQFFIESTYIFYDVTLLFFSTLNFIVTLSLIICDNILFLTTLNSSGFFFLHITVPTSVGEIQNGLLIHFDGIVTYFVLSISI